MNNIADKKILSMFGLAARAGKIASGEFQTETAVKSGTAYLVVVAEDASDNTKKDFSDMCTYYHVPFYVFGTKDMIGHAIGKEFRVVLAFTNLGLSDKIAEQINILLENRIND